MKNIKKLKPVFVLLSALAIIISSHFLLSDPSAIAAPPVGWVDDGTVVRLDTDTDSVGIGTTTPSEKLTVVGNIEISGLIDGYDISVSGADWDTAFSQTLQWSGTSTNLNAADGRTSLGLGSLAVLNSVNSSTIADNSITNVDVATSSFPNIVGVGALPFVVLENTDDTGCHKVTVNSAGTLSTQAVNCDTFEDTTASISENFDSYSAGSLSGNNGGTGWGEAWQAVTNDWDVVTSGCQSGAACAKRATTDGIVDRDLSTGITSGTISFYAKKISASGTQRFTLQSTAGSKRFNLSWQGTGDPQAGNLILSGTNGESTAPSVGTYTAGSWQLVEVEFGSGGCSANQARARLAGGSWTSCESYANNGNLENVKFEFAGSTGREMWFDEISISE